MIVQLSLLSIALLLLWFPRQWMRFGFKVFELPSLPPPPPSDDSVPNTRDLRDISLKSKKEFVKLRNWIDLFRALAGGFAIWMGAFEVIPGEAKTIGTQVFAMQCAILVISIFIQTVRFTQGNFTLVAPVFFLLGLSFSLIGWQAALFACVAVWIINRVLGSPSAFLFVFAALEGAFGLMLRRVSLSMMLLAIFLAIFPVIISAMTNRRLVRINKPQKKQRKRSE